MKFTKGWLFLPGIVVALFLLLFMAVLGGMLGSAATFYILSRQPTATPRPAGLVRPAPGTPVSAPPGSVSPNDPRLTTVQLVQKITPTVVTILTGRTEGGGRAFVRGAGSGVIVDRDGLILTNQHVVGEEDTVQVILSDGRRVQGKVLARDAGQDLAIVRVEGEMPAVAELGDSDLVAVGEPVLAVGSALGEYQGSVTFGIVSGLNRRLPSGTSAVSGLIQTDAALNHGNSGGPLFNFAGQVIGLNTAVVRNSGNPGEAAEALGFAIPSNRARAYYNQVVAQGAVPRPDLGVSYVSINASTPWSESGGEPAGAVVKQVTASSAAARAGLREGDIIIAVNNEKITESIELKDLLAKYHPGDEIEVTFKRAGQEQKVRLTLGSKQ